MRAVLDRDLIIHITSAGDTDIGSPAAGVGLERLRFDGERLVDLAELSEIWVEPVPGGGHHQGKTDGILRKQAKHN